MTNSTECTQWPIMTATGPGGPDDLVVGLNMTSFSIAVQDFDFALNVSGLTPEQDAEVTSELEKLITAAKPEIIAALPTTVSTLVAKNINTKFAEVPKEQVQHPCAVNTIPWHIKDHTSLLNVSRVCITNNAGFDLQVKQKKREEEEKSKEKKKRKSKTKRMRYVANRMYYIYVYIYICIVIDIYSRLGNSGVSTIVRQASGRLRFVCI